MWSTQDSKEKIVEKINNSQGVTESITIGLAFLNYKSQEELLKSQNEYNSKQLFWSRVLSLATIALVIATLLIVKFG